MACREGLGLAQKQYVSIGSNIPTSRFRIRRVRMPLGALRDIRNFFQETKDVRHETFTRVRAVAETLKASLRFPSETPLNQKIGPNRRFDWLTMKLADIKTIRRVFGGSVNDVVLTMQQRTRHHRKGLFDDEESIPYHMHPLQTVYVVPLYDP